MLTSEYVTNATQKSVISVGTIFDTSNAQRCYSAGAPIDNTPSAIRLSDCQFEPGGFYTAVVLLSDTGVALQGGAAHLAEGALFKKHKHNT